MAATTATTRTASADDYRGTLRSDPFRLGWPAAIRRSTGRCCGPGWRPIPSPRTGTQACIGHRRRGMAGRHGPAIRATRGARRDPCRVRAGTQRARRAARPGPRASVLLPPPVQDDACLPLTVGNVPDRAQPDHHEHARLRGGLVLALPARIRASTSSAGCAGDRWPRSTCSTPGSTAIRSRPTATSSASPNAPSPVTARSSG